jgi:hypothetical protein
VLLDQLLTVKELEQVYCCNEPNCGYSAEGYARACGAAAVRRFLPPQVADLIVASGTEKQLESHRREIAPIC